MSLANGASKIVTPLVEYIHQRRLDREKYREEKKEERRRKELEKKKLRDVERTKKREAKKDEKKQEKLQANKSKKEEEKPATPIKVCLSFFSLYSGSIIFLTFRRC